MVKNQYADTAWLYDLDQRDNLTQDIPFYLEYAARAGGEVLELACGTGRVALALAKAGYAVTGLDLSRPMLAIFSRKLAEQPAEVRALVTVVQGDMARFALGRRFPQIIAPFRAFQALTAEEDIEGCLRCVHQHLTPGGLFIVNTFRPYKKLDESWRYPYTVQWTREDGPDGAQVIKKHRGRHIDPEKQIIYPEFLYEVRRRDGVVEEYAEQLSLKYYYAEQLRALLETHGFRIQSGFGWYDKSPIEDGRELIFVCERASDSVI